MLFELHYLYFVYALFIVYAPFSLDISIGY